MTALIDGQHKAMAAAVEHKKVNALVIMPCYTIRCRKNDEKLMASYIQAGDIRFACDEYELVSSYPDADEMADIDEIGEISNEWLNQIVSEECICNVDEIGTLIKALGGLKHERLWEIADYFLRRCSYLSFFRLHDTNTVTTIIKVLMKMPRSNELEKYLLDIMVEYEDEYPSVRELIVDYI